MNTVILRNTFHNTSVRVRTFAGTPAEAWEEIKYACYEVGFPWRAQRRYNRICKVLCGRQDCTCGVFRP